MRNNSIAGMRSFPPDRGVTGDTSLTRQRRGSFAGAPGLCEEETSGPLDVLGKMPFARVLYGFVIPVSHADGLLMILGLENDLLILGQGFVHQGRQVVQAAEGRHRSPL